MPICFHIVKWFQVLLSNINSFICIHLSGFATSYNKFYSLFICSHTVKSFHILLYKTHKKVKLATLVEGDLKAPFSIATTPRCRGGRYSIPWITLLYS